jgi:hypothetical protein
MVTLDRETLEAALIGYEQQRQAVVSKIAELEAYLGGGLGAVGPRPKKGRRTFSAETRAKMAASQQKRRALAKKALK